MSDTPRGALYPVLPLRDIVVFPHMIVPLFVGREKSVRALEDVMKEDKQILLLAQKSALWRQIFEYLRGAGLMGRHLALETGGGEASAKLDEGDEVRNEIDENNESYENNENYEGDESPTMIAQGLCELKPAIIDVSCDVEPSMQFLRNEPAKVNVLFGLTNTASVGASSTMLSMV